MTTVEQQLEMLTAQVTALGTRIDQLAEVTMQAAKFRAVEDIIVSTAPCGCGGTRMPGGRRPRPPYLRPVS